MPEQISPMQISLKLAEVRVCIIIFCYFTRISGKKSICAANKKPRPVAERGSINPKKTAVILQQKSY
jgi:hypothetical protein